MPTAAIAERETDERALPTAEELRVRLQSRYGDLSKHGWRVNQRWRFGYFPPEVWYELVVDRLVTDETIWIDVGGGTAIFPHNHQLSRTLADRCRRLTGVDPSDNIHQNEFVHEGVNSSIEEYTTDQSFDLATLRMVAEHIEQPELAVASLARLVKPGGKVIVYTPNRWSLTSLVASITPQRLHQWVTHSLWRAKKRDVFPTFYRMNTRKRLRSLFREGGFREVDFACLEDCSVLQRFRSLYPLELTAWRIWRKTGIRYPDSNLLGVYARESG